LEVSAWVIGGTSGIGAAIANRLGDHGTLVWATGEAVDVTSYELLLEQIDQIAEETKNDDRLEQVYFCAGVTELQWLGMMGPVGTDNQVGLLEVNVGGFIKLMDILVHMHREEKLVRLNGPPMKVCAISSDAGERPMRTSIGYCASKAALNMAIRVAARELGPSGWKIFGIAPGMMDDTKRFPSKMTVYVDHRVPEVRIWTQEQATLYEQQQAVVDSPLRINPDVIADFAVETMLRAGRHINGSIIQFNGGR
jgi:NAD(P)-dependent dehydrogenase (short-subunit alcohol dehydrogenase family)